MSILSTTQTYKEPEIVKSYFIPIKNMNTGSIGAVYEALDSNAVEVKDGEIHFHPSKMINGKYYNFVYKEKEHLIRKSSDNIIDIYEV